MPYDMIIGKNLSMKFHLTLNFGTIHIEVGRGKFDGRKTLTRGHDDVTISDKFRYWYKQHPME